MLFAESVLQYYKAGKQTLVLGHPLFLIHKTGDKHTHMTSSA